MLDDTDDFENTGVVDTAVQSINNQPDATDLSSDNHRESVCAMITKQLSERLDSVAHRKYDTKVSVTATDKKDPLKLDVHIETNDPRIIAALAAAGGM